MDAAWAGASASGPSIHQAGKALSVSRLPAVAAAVIADGRIGNNYLSLATETLHTRNEPLACDDSGVRYDALAVCVHWVRNQAVAAYHACSLHCFGQWEDPHLAEASILFGNCRPRSVD